MPHYLARKLLFVQDASIIEAGVMQRIRWWKIPIVIQLSAEHSSAMVEGRLMIEGVSKSTNRQFASCIEDLESSQASNTIIHQAIRPRSQQ